MVSEVTFPTLDGDFFRPQQWGKPGTGTGIARKESFGPSLYTPRRGEFCCIICLKKCKSETAYNAQT